MEALTSTLNSARGLEIRYRKTQTNKIQLDGISLKVDGICKAFTLNEIWINGQPAAYLKGFKRKIIQELSGAEPDIKEGKLHLLSDAFEGFKITVVHKEENHQFTVGSKLRVRGLQSMIERKIECSDSTLRNSTATPLQEERTLGYYHIKEGATLTITANEEDHYTLADRENNNSENLEDGKGLGIASLPFVNFQQVESVPFSEDADVWRRVIEGLNLEAICPNEDCEAFNKQVCVTKKLGMGKFSMSEKCAKAKCPCCKSPLKEVINCIFLKCRYSIKGQLVDSEKKIRQKDKIAPDGEGTSFAEITEGHSNIAQWRYLRIRTKPLPTPTIRDLIGI